MDGVVVIPLLAISLVVATYAAPGHAGATGADDGRWAKILGGRPQGVLPAPPDKVIWRADLSQALADARAQGRPLFVTMRCLPCKQCADFDKDVLEGGPALDPLLRQFVTVRLTDVQNVDTRLLPLEQFQDLDLSWWGWFLSPQGQVYGVFGGRDHVSDSTRISAAALANTLGRVLEHHYDPRRAEWDVDGPPASDAGAPQTPKDLPGYDAWRDRSHAEVKAQSCIHCHQVAEILRQPALDAKTFDKQRDLQVWPLPENVGLILDRDHGLLVKSVAPDGPASAAGLKPGDVLGAAGGRRLFGQADFRGVLHRGPAGAGEIDVHWLREGKVMSADIRLQDGWRTTVLDWRMSVSQGNVGAGPGFFPLPLNADRRKQRNVPAGKMAVEPYMGPNPAGHAFAAGVRPGHVITAADGESPDLAGRAFLVWFRMRYDPGDTVTFTVRNEQGRDSQVTCELPTRGKR
jgi:hypothetical protein